MTKIDKMYPSSFYVTRHQETLYAADRMLSLVLERFPAIASAIDVGCGVGSFLSVLGSKGINDIHGIDGEWVDRSMLMIGSENFNAADLRYPPELHRKFDLAICLEVAEHLPPDCASQFIDWLCEASDVVLFSAAIPGQGGKNHFNEAWQSYWVGMFHKNGFHVCDFVRPAMWNDKKIAYWYRQNTLVFTKHPNQFICEYPIPIDVVHPELYETYSKRPRLRGLLKMKLQMFFKNHVL
jgi:hypothetical protein